MGWDIRKPLQVTVKKPKITLSDKDRAGVLGWAAGGGPVGGFLIGQKYGDKMGKWGTNTWNSMTGKNAREAQEAAARESEKTRRNNVVKEFGARQQADSLAFSASMNGQGPSAGNNAPGLVGETAAPGTIGSNITSSGTF